MRKYCDCGKINDLKIFMDLYAFSNLEYEKLAFGMFSACMPVCVCALLMHEWLDRFFPLTDLCSVNVNILDRKIRTPHSDPQTYILVFFYLGITISVKFI